MQIVESVAQDTKCMLSGLQARSDTAVKLLRIEEMLTSFMSAPSLKRLPVLFHLLLLFDFFLFVECGFDIFKRLFGADAVHLFLEGCDLGLATVLPKDDGSFIVSTCKHSPETIPPDAVDRTQMVLQQCQAPLLPCLVAGKQAFHEGFILRKILRASLLAGVLF